MLYFPMYRLKHSKPFQATPLGAPNPRIPFGRGWEKRSAPVRLLRMNGHGCGRSGLVKMSG